MKPNRGSAAGGLLSDPAARRAYVLAKLAVFAVAALATWPLSRAIGPTAWVGLVVFGALLAVTAVVVLALGSAARRTEHESADRSGDRHELRPDPVDIDDPSELEVEIPIEDALDLHPFQPRDIPDVVTTYLEQAVAKGLSEVRLIHGRGIGVQRERVRSVLAKHPDVIEYSDGTADRGGWGATVARLRVRDD